MFSEASKLCHLHSMATGSTLCWCIRAGPAAGVIWTLSGPLVRDRGVMLGVRVRYVVDIGVARTSTSTGRMYEYYDYRSVEPRTATGVAIVVNYNIDSCVHSAVEVFAAALFPVTKIHIVNINKTSVARMNECKLLKIFLQ
eukprot:scaffold555676_cov22-Prasinocladus_malaysianus.AAC.1